MRYGEAKGDTKRLGSRRQLRGAVFGAVIVMLMAAGYFLWWLCRPPILATTRLTDGTKLTLQGISYGPNGLFDPEPPLLRWLQSIRVPLRLNSPQRAFSPYATLWLDLDTARVSARFNTAAQLAFQVVDAHGCRTQIDSINLYSDRYCRLALSYLPLSDEEWSLHVVQSDSPDTELGRIRFPVRGQIVPSKSRPTPAPLPQAISGKSARVTLKSLGHRLESKLPCSVAQLTAVGKGGPGDHWFPWELAAYDSRGRLGPEPDWPIWDLQTNGNVPFNGTCRREPFWKLVATCGPNPPTTREPDFRWNGYHFSIRGTKTPGGPKTLRTDRGMSWRSIRTFRFRTSGPESSTCGCLSISLGKARNTS